MFAGLSIIISLIILGFLWPLTFAYAIYKLSENTKLTIILTSTATISVFVAQIYYPDLPILVAIFCILLAIGAWMYEEAR
jgi:hypothetical protein